MIKEIPTNWEYNDSMENLLLFYECSEELLSKSSADTYKVSVHNSITLCYELRFIYSHLKSSNQIERFYTKYIIDIIDELLYNLQSDIILKKVLGVRLKSIQVGLSSARNIPSELLRWVNLILQSCTLEKYAFLHRKEIEALVQSKTDKKKLIDYINKFFVSLINLNYNIEYLYQTTKKFFNNRNRIINDAGIITKFLNIFNLKPKKIILYLVANTYLIDNFTSIKKLINNILDFEFKKVSDEFFEKKTSTSKTISKFFDNYKKAKTTENISIIKCSTTNLDPYSALEEIHNSFELIQSFTGYYSHQSERKIYFDVLQHENEFYIPIKLRNYIYSRPYINQETINKRINEILSNSLLSQYATQTLVSSMGMHLDALNCKSDETMLRTFWAAVETLFFDSHNDSEKENGQYSLLHIIQKTYILKLLRNLYFQMKQLISLEDLKTLKIIDFKSFAEFFATYEADSTNFKKLTSYLSLHPLFRTRIYNLRKELTDGKHILQKIEYHKNKILWQIARIYRTRNLSAHSGKSVPFIRDILYNLHNYFDYVVNYIVCKIENGDYVNSISSLVFEAKNDNLIYQEFLKTNESLNKDNFIFMLFGPDENIINYEYETE